MSKPSLYIIESSFGLVKVGVSSSPRKRIRGLSTGGGFDVVNEFISDEIDFALLYEQEIHSRLSEFRKIGEWFSVPFSDAFNVLSDVVDSFNPKESSSKSIQSVNHRETSQQAKQLGAQSLQQVAEFYECTTQHLRNVHKRNQKAFEAMVIGFIQVANNNR